MKSSLGVRVCRLVTERSLSTRGDRRAGIRDHRKLEVFQLADELVLQVFRESERFPRSEMFGLVSHLRRCPVSVAANIAEG
jgi:hypothetical protein